MAEKERLTKKERRERARQERKRKEAEAARRARRNRIVSWTSSLVVGAGVVAVMVLAFAGGESGVEDTIFVAASEAEAAQSAAGCEQLQVQQLPPRHVDPASAPPADQMYPGVRPAASGPHFETPLAATTYTNPADERGLTHNLEHGSVIVYYTPEQLEDDTVGAIESWAERMAASGFSNQTTSSGVITTPFPGETTSGKPIALRAWGVALDCEQFDETVANQFLLNTYGTHGSAPEGSFAEFPEDTLQYQPNDRPTGQAPGSGEGGDAGEQTPAEDGTTDGDTADDDAAEDGS